MTAAPEQVEDLRSRVRTLLSEHPPGSTERLDFLRAQFDAEEFAHLAIEVGDVGLWPADDADRHVALCRQ